MYLTVISLVVTALASTATAQATCGTLTLEGGQTQTIWRGACYSIQGKAVSARVDASCDCIFSK